MTFQETGFVSFHSLQCSQTSFQWILFYPWFIGELFWLFEWKYIWKKGFNKSCFESDYYFKICFPFQIPFFLKEEKSNFAGSYFPSIFVAWQFIRQLFLHSRRKLILDDSFFVGLYLMMPNKLSLVSDPCPLPDLPCVKQRKVFSIILLSVNQWVSLFCCLKKKT